MVNVLFVEKKMRGEKMENYEAMIESEIIFEKEIAYLQVSHKGNGCWNGIRIDDPLYEIPILLRILEYYLKEKENS